MRLTQSQVGRPDDGTFATIDIHADLAPETYLGRGRRKADLAEATERD